MTAACVLVVDDDAGVRHMLVDYLGAHDYEVTAVANGAEMRASLARRVPDVVLLDVGLPGEDGLSPTFSRVCMGWSHCQMRYQRVIRGVQSLS